MIIVPEGAETVRTMFRLYLECGSVGALAEELARRNIVSKVRTFVSGGVKGGGRYSVGALAHFLKNRFYIGEVVYRGETHAGEHASIIDRSIFEAVQAKLAENARARQVRVESSPAILMGRIFDDRRNRMTPSHFNKDGVRYRYYVSHTLLQRREKDASRVTRVAPTIQSAVEPWSDRFEFDTSRFESSLPSPHRGLSPVISSTHGSGDISGGYPPKSPVSAEEYRAFRAEG
jgi:hypothetical protein